MEEMSKRKPLADKKNEWTDKKCQRLWDMYMEGKGTKTIAQTFGCTVHEIDCKKWKLIGGNDRDKAGSVHVVGPDRRGRPWRKRDVKVLQMAKQNGVKVVRIAELLGRTVKEVNQKINPRLGRRTFFPTGETDD